jgi:hypothetical protein
MLPTGQALWASDVGDVQIYTPLGKPAANAIPAIVGVATTIHRGSSNNEVDGTGFNGLTFGGYYGDDVQETTNYPLVRFTNNATGDVCYAKTHSYVSGISDGSTTSAQFDVPNTCEKGKSKMVVVVNGIPSRPVAVKIAR